MNECTRKYTIIHFTNVKDYINIIYILCFDLLIFIDLKIY